VDVTGWSIASISRVLRRWDDEDFRDENDEDWHVLLVVGDD